MAETGREGERQRARTRRLRLEAALRRANALIEVVDARAPAASRSPLMARGRFAARPRVVVLARADLARPEVTRLWLEHLGAAGTPALAADARAGRGTAAVLSALRRLRPAAEVRAMVVGLPNLGKSSLVNRLAGTARAATGDRPGVTVGEQWVRARPWLLLLDEPGVLPAGGSPLLAALGCLAEGEYDPEEAFAALWSVDEVRAVLGRRWPGAGEAPTAAQALEACARALGAVASGGRWDGRRAARQVLGLFRSGRLGRLSLELPPSGGEGP